MMGELPGRWTVLVDYGGSTAGHRWTAVGALKIARSNNDFTAGLF